NRTQQCEADVRRAGVPDDQATMEFSQGQLRSPRLARCQVMLHPPRRSGFGGALPPVSRVGRRTATGGRMTNAATLTASVIRLPDGRDLSFCEFGDRDGIPVFAFHGTPGSRLQVAPTDATPLPPGYRLIVPDRPGYGHSAFYSERRLIDWPKDVATLADFLAIERFARSGLSGGGPHVLACAHALAPRLIGVGCVSGVGPLWDPAAAEGMLALNRWLTVL